MRRMVSRSLIVALAAVSGSFPLWAGGYGGGKSCCRIAPQEAATFLSIADYYQDGAFRVRHSDRSGAQAKTGSGSDFAFGFGESETEIQFQGGVKSWKRSIQRGSAHAATGSAAASGFSASFLKVRTADGKYYMYKGYASTGASVGAGGAATQQAGFGKSVGGRF